MPRFCCVSRQELHTNIFYNCEERCKYHLLFVLWLYLIADLAEERLVRDPRWCGSRQVPGPQPELQQEEKYFNKSKNIYTTSWRLISLDTQHSSSRSGRIICSAKGQKRYQNWCPIIFGCDDAMLCWLTAHSWRTLHSDGTVMAFLKQLWKTKRLILCKKINIILSQTPAFHEFFTNMKAKTNCSNPLGPNNNVYVCGTVQWLELFENVPSTRHQISNNSKSGHNM